MADLTAQAQKSRLQREIAENRAAAAAAKARAKHAAVATRATLHLANSMLNPGGSAAVSPQAHYQTNLSRGGMNRPGGRVHGTGGAQWTNATGQDLESLRDQCRALTRDYQVARAIVKTHAAMVVGDGAVVRSTTKDEAWNAEADRLFNQWAEGYGGELLGPVDVEERRTLWEICSGIVTEWDEAGDVLAARLGEGSERPGTLQLIEAERLGGSRMDLMRRNAGTAQSVNRIIDGVERSPQGRPLRYWVSDWDASGYSKTTSTIPFPADECLLLINPTDDRIGRVRGEPGLQAMVGPIERLENYRERHAIAALIATMFGLIVTSNNPADLQAGMHGTDSNQPNDGGPGSMKLDAGGIYNAPAGTTVAQVKPEAPNTNYREYVTFEVMLAAADLGVPYSFALFDASEVSYISARAMGAVAMRRFDAQQASIARFVRWVRSWKVDQWIKEGLLTSNEQFERCDVNLPPAPVFDMGAEVRAMRTAIEGNLMSEDQACQLLGTGTAVDVAKARSAEVKRSKDLGIEPSPMMPGNPRTGEPTKAAAAGGGEDPPPPESGNQ